MLFAPWALVCVVHHTRWLERPTTVVGAPSRLIQPGQLRIVEDRERRPLLGHPSHRDHIPGLCGDWLDLTSPRRARTRTGKLRRSTRDPVEDNNDLDLSRG